MALGGSAPALGGPPDERVIHLDVDPSAAAGALPHRTLVLAGDVRDGLASLLVALGDGPARADRLWLDSLVAAHKAHIAQLLEGADDGVAPMHPAVLARELGDWLPDDALAVYDGGHTTFWSNDLTPALEPRTRFHDPGMAHLGFGLPYALALQARASGAHGRERHGRRRFGFTLAELDTARRHGLPVVTVIHDNAAWGVIRFGQARAGFELDTALEGADYAAVARAFGCHGETVTNAAEIRPALDRALASGLPAVVDVQTRFVPHPRCRASRRWGGSDHDRASTPTRYRRAAAAIRDDVEPHRTRRSSMTSVLPTDLTEQALDAALDGFRAAVGAEHVLTDVEQLREFRDPYWFAAWDDYEASAVVQPESVEELQAVVRIANDRGVPLWVSSQGRNNGYGGSSPACARGRRREPAADEPRARDRRRRRLCGRRARRRASSTCTRRCARRATSCGSPCPTSAGGA